jgi:hypothetical protein
MTTKEEFIIGYLGQKSETFVFDIFEAWQRFKPTKPGTYANFRKTLSILRKKGDVIPTKREIVATNRWPRTYYQLTQQGMQRWLKQSSKT